MKNPIIDTLQIKGWGVDADPQNDPTYPMRQHVNGEHAGYSWERPPQQETDLEILQTNERPHLPAVFGTTSPPAGLSGMLRRFAFKYSESSYGHWLPLVLADRIGVVEGILSDLSRGHIPNLWVEMGGGAEWKHNRKEFVTRSLIGALFVWALVRHFRGEKQKF